MITTEKTISAEEAIRKLEWILEDDRFGFGVNWRNGDQPQSEEEQAGKYITEVIDLIKYQYELLKEQEPKRMCLCNGELCCPQCGAICKSYYHYCNECGQAVKWDE